MPEDREKITARVVPLDSAEAARPPSPGTASERLALVTALSREAWTLAGRALPDYSRASMPVAISTLEEQGQS